LAEAIGQFSGYPPSLDREKGRGLFALSQYSLTEHFLLSAYGGKWKEVTLVMFTVFVDDSGTAPDQPVAIAGALIIPAIQIPNLEADWAAFGARDGFTYFHSSECAAKNYKSQFAKWDDAKVEKAFERARRIIKKRTSRAFAFAVHKEDFDAEAPAEYREVGGENHYTWALRTLLNVLVQWHREREIIPPFEFVFDWAEGIVREEIEMLMAQFESIFPGMFEGHYSFRKKQDVPGLQCADVLAWTYYGTARQVFRKVPMNAIAKNSFIDFSSHQNRQWLNALTFERKALREAIAFDMADTSSMQARAQWFREWKASRVKSET
jgi:Protein of unknown function (DUF3800)